MKDFIMIMVIGILVAYFIIATGVFFTGTTRSSIFTDRLCVSKNYSRLITYTGLVYFYKAGCYMGKDV